MIRRAASLALVAMLAARPVSAEPVGGSRVDCAVSGACCFPRAPHATVPIHEPRPPALAALTLRTEGGLARAVLRRVLGQHLLELATCGQPGQHVTARLVISPTGTIQYAAVPAVDATTTRCTTFVLRAVRFPRSAGGAITDVEVRLAW